MVSINATRLGGDEKRSPESPETAGFVVRPWLVRLGLVVATSAAGLALLGSPAQADTGLGLGKTVDAVTKTVTKPVVTHPTKAAAKPTRTPARSHQAAPVRQAHATPTKARPTLVKTTLRSTERTVSHVVKATTTPVKRATKPVAAPVAKVVKPVAKVVKPVAKPVAKVAKPVVRPVEKVTQPVLSAASTTVGQAAAPVVQVTTKTLDHVGLGGVLPAVVDLTDPVVGILDPVVTLPTIPVVPGLPGLPVVSVPTAPVVGAPVVPSPIRPGPAALAATTSASTTPGPVTLLPTAATTFAALSPALGEALRDVAAVADPDVATAAGLATAATVLTVAVTAGATGTASGGATGLSILALVQGFGTGLAGAATARVLNPGRRTSWRLPRQPGFAPD